MKNSVCYILYCQKINKFYVGVTQESVSLRIQKYNQKEYGTQSFTVQTNVWDLFLFIKTSNYKHALRLERKIKSMKSSLFIRNLKKYPELIDKIVNQTKVT
ncbi:MAG TPA: hypothetical protein EYG92_05195 [Lutibacter sp.]|nr:hypothetical protein [Lutibacter sp.]